MAVGTGYSKVASSGLVFAYDSGDSFNSYIGEPTTNLTNWSQDYSQWYGNLFGNWINSDVTLNASIAPDGTLTGNRFGNGYSRYTNSITATTNTIYTFSVWLKNVSLTGSGVSLYWSFGLNGGLVSYGNGLSVGIGTLTNQWQRFTFTVTSPSSGINQLQFGVVTFTGYGGNNSGQQVDVWGAQVEQKPHMTQYLPTTSGTATRSTTQALLDISGGGNTITLANMSYDNNAMFYFDGTDDYISNNKNIPHGTDEFSYFALVKLSGKPSLGTIFENGSWTSCILIRYQTNGIAIYSMGNYWGFFNFDPPLNTWYYLGFVRRGNTLYFYVNGINTASIGFSANIIPSPNLYVGMSQHAAGQCFNGSINVASVYTRALTDTEILSNYSHYKTRFNLP